MPPEKKNQDQNKQTAETESSSEEESLSEELDFGALADQFTSSSTSRMSEESETSEGEEELESKEEGEKAPSKVAKPDPESSEAQEEEEASPPLAATEGTPAVEKKGEETLESVSEKPKELSPEDRAKQYEEYWEGQRKAVREHYSKALAGTDLFAEDQVPFLAQLAADIHTNTAQGIMLSIGQMAAPLVQNLLQQETARQKAEERFFQAWPGLRKPEFSNDIKVAAETLRERLPDASMDDLIQQTGAFICAARKLDPREVAGAGDTSGNGKSGETNVETKPAARPAPAGNRPLRTVGGQSTSVTDVSKPIKDNTPEMFGALVDAWESQNR